MATETSLESVRSLLVVGLPKGTDEIYLFNCFHDNAEVLVATLVRDEKTGEPQNYGFVELATHKDAEFVMEYYNGQRMPNFNHVRFRLIWDTDLYGLMWRYILRLRDWSYFGFFGDSVGIVRDADSVRKQYSDDLDLTALKSLCLPADIWSEYRNSVQHVDESRDDLHRSAAAAAASIDVEIEKEPELCLCFEEGDNHDRPCYVIRSIKLSELKACQCDFNRKCVLHCTTKTKNKLIFRQRAWLYAAEKAPDSCNGNDTTLQLFMSCCPSLLGSSQIIFAGGVCPAKRRPDVCKRFPSILYCKYEPCQDVYSLNLHDNSTRWEKHDSRVPPGVPGSLLFEINGIRYCFAIKPRRCTWGNLEDLHWKELTSNCHGWVVLPYPFRDYLSQKKVAPTLHYYTTFERMAYAVVGSKILISSKDFFPSFPIMCIDVNDKEKKWKEMPSLHDGKPFPFFGRALVLDMTNGTSDKLMFGYCDKFRIYVARIRVDDVTGDMRIISWYDDAVHPDYDDVAMFKSCQSKIGFPTFVNLGDGKVALIISNVKDHSRGKARLFFFVLKYKELNPRDDEVMCDNFAAHIFEYNCHASAIDEVYLKCGFVV